MSVQDSSSSPREILADWVRAVMKRHKMSAESWGRLAGTSPTNITRLLRPGKYAPTAKTLAKMASVVGEQPPMMASSQITDSTRIALLSKVETCDYAALSRSGRRSFLMKKNLEKIVVQVEAAGCLAVTLTNDGIRTLAGDIVIVDPEGQPEDGVLVCILDGQATEVRRFDQGFYVNLDGRLSQSSSVKMLGIAKSVIRHL